MGETFFSKGGLLTGESVSVEDDVTDPFSLVVSLLIYFTYISAL